MKNQLEMFVSKRSGASKGCEWRDSLLHEKQPTSKISPAPLVARGSACWKGFLSERDSSLGFGPGTPHQTLLLIVLKITSVGQVVVAMPAGGVLPWGRGRMLWLPRRCASPAASASSCTARSTAGSGEVRHEVSLGAFLRCTQP